jgi:hypothetical protein
VLEHVAGAEGFLQADTFTDSLSKLTGREQRAFKTVAFDLQVNPAQPGMRMRQFERPKDPTAGRSE